MKTRLRLYKVTLLIGFGLTLAYVGWKANVIPSTKELDQKATLLPLADNTSTVTERTPRGKPSDKIPNILVVSQDNESYRFYDDLVKDRIVIANLMYTTCDGICPGTTRNLGRVHKLLGDRVGRDILFVSISIDEQDTPEKLKAYAENFGEKKGWYYLTGDYDEIELLRRRLGLYDLDPVIDADKTQHGFQ